MKKSQHSEYEKSKSLGLPNHRRKARYKEKLVNTHESAAGLVLKRRRNLLIILYLVLCIAAGFLFYETYSSKKMSDIPGKAIVTDDDNKVSTGTELLPNADFGPWQGVGGSK